MNSNSTRKSVMNGLPVILACFTGALLLGWAALPAWAQTHSVLHAFTHAEGTGLSGPLLLSGTTLYGTASLGGAPAGVGGGTVFKLDTDGTDFTVLHVFDDLAGPAEPTGGLVLSDGVLYGTTSSGPPIMHGFRAVFRVNTDGTGFQILRQFMDNSSWPWIGPVLISGSTLYGTFGSGPTTGVGANNGNGTLYRMDADGSNYAVLKYFGALEGPPSGFLTLGSDTLYGISQPVQPYIGGAGVYIYRINTDGSGYSSLWQSPSDTSGTDLISSGNTLYGSTSYGTFWEPFGSIFALNMDGSGFRYLRNSAQDGGGGFGNLVVAGTVAFGTQSSNLFQMNIDGTGYTVLTSVPGISGRLVYSNRTLYGVTAYMRGSSIDSVFAISLQPPNILASPRSRTVEVGGTTRFTVKSSGSATLWYNWFLNATNSIACTKESWLELTNLQAFQTGLYSVVITNPFGAVTSAPAMLNVIPAVPRQPTPAITATGQPISSFDLEYADSLEHSSNWMPLIRMSLTNSVQTYCDLTAPRFAQRFYRARVFNPSSPIPTLALNLVPTIIMNGAIGETLRLDFINEFGPTDMWVNLATVTLTNTSQLYFDFSAVGQPSRLYRINHVQ